MVSDDKVLVIIKFTVSSWICCILIYWCIYCMFVDTAYFILYMTNKCFEMEHGCACWVNNKASKNNQKLISWHLQNISSGWNNWILGPKRVLIWQFKSYMFLLLPDSGNIVSAFFQRLNTQKFPCKFGSTYLKFGDFPNVVSHTINSHTPTPRGEVHQEHFLKTGLNAIVIYQPLVNK